MEMSKKLAVIFPGIGYHKDKPLLYYAAKLAQSKGYELAYIEYHDMPQKIKGDAAMMKQAAEIAFEQSSALLDSLDLPTYDDILFIGKSIGTVAAAKYASDHQLLAKQVWYTPLAATFSFSSPNVIAFIGDDDPWSDVNALKQTASEQGIELYSYPHCNHSLECTQVDINITNLQDVMQHTDKYI